MDVSIEELTIDEIFDNFDLDRDLKLSSLKNETVDFWKQDDYDKKCTSELHSNCNSKYERTCDNPLKTKYYICVNCRILMKLVDVKDPFQRTDIYLEDGKKVCIKVVKYTQIRPKIYLNPKNTWIILSSRLNNQVTKIIACDSFSNNILISWILNNIFKSAELRFTERILKAFVCHNNGYLINYMRPKYLKNTVCSENIDDIVYQLKLFCKILGNYDYYHGNYSIDNINFYKHGKLIPGVPKRKFRIIMSINNFDNASITLDLIRIMRHNKEQDNNLDIISFNYNSSYNNVISCKGYFKIRYNQNTDYMFSVGIHKFKVEYNFYNWIIALCQDKNFFYVIRRTCLWFKLWKQDELRILEDRIHNSKENYNTKSILSSISMKIDILNDV